MRSRLLLNLGLATLLLVLVAILILEPGNTPAPATIPLTQLNAADIQSISISKPGYPLLRLQKQGAQWYMQAPFQAPANSGRIEKLLALVSARSVSRFALAQADLRQLRLEQPQYRLQLDNIKLAFGTTEPLSGNRYVQLDDSVHLILDRYSYLMQGSAEDFIDSRLLPENPALVAIELPGLSLKRDADGWHLVAPLAGENAPASADRINQLVDNWRYARALKVRRMDNGQPGPAGQALVIGLQGQARPIVFSLRQNSDEIIFQRPALGLQYHFSLANGQNLLSLAPPAATANGQ